MFALFPLRIETPRPIEMIYTLARRSNFELGVGALLALSKRYLLH